MFFKENEKGIEVSLYQDLKQRVLEYRKHFYRIFFNRYLEMLPTLISYKNTVETSIDFLKVEVALLSNHDVVIGEATNKQIMVLGYARSRQTVSNPSQLFFPDPLTKDDITFTVAPHLVPDEMKEITWLDNCESGNFVVIRNKVLNYVSDVEVIEHYTSHLSEIALSHYSLAMQSKLTTFFKGDENDESISQLVAELYNGSPFVKTGKMFDEEENIIHLKNEHISSIFKELKYEYQNIIGELNNALGINSLAVDKESGVSDTEANSNRSFTTSVANIKLDTRNDGYKRLNKRYGLSIEAVYNDNVASEFAEIQKITGDENG